jgi:hypothetical protein
LAVDHPCNTQSLLNDEPSPRRNRPLFNPPHRAGAWQWRDAIEKLKADGKIRFTGVIARVPFDEGALTEEIPGKLRSLPQLFSFPPVYRRD